MKVHLIKKQTIEDYVVHHAASKSSFTGWFNVIKNADWNKPNDIQKTFGSVDLLGRGTNRVVFNIAGNNYRMICKYAFGSAEAHLFICWIGTHAEYDQLCNANKQYAVSNY